jgi:hypothetical protein
MSCVFDPALERFVQRTKLRTGNLTKEETLEGFSIVGFSIDMTPEMDFPPAANSMLSVVHHVKGTSGCAELISAQNLRIPNSAMPPSFTAISVRILSVELLRGQYR